MEQRNYDHQPYKAHYLVENFCAWLKQDCGITARYYKTAPNFLGAVHLDAAVI